MKLKNKLLLGDCLEIMPDIPDNSIDMILADLPFNQTKNKWDIIIPFDKLWEQYNRIIKTMVLLRYSHKVYLLLN